MSITCRKEKGEAQKTVKDILKRVHLIFLGERDFFLLYHEGISNIDSILYDQK
jgi:hypothetical protein